MAGGAEGLVTNVGLSLFASGFIKNRDIALVFALSPQQVFRMLRNIFEEAFST